MMRSLCLFLGLLLPLSAQPLTKNPKLQRVDVVKLLPPGPGNPRNTEGSFVTLKDKRVMFAYTKFTGGTSDHAAATIVARYSSDGGRTWTAEDREIVANEGGMNVMSVSLLRLRDGRIALFYLRKNSTTDCRPYLRFSSDEGRTWSDPVLCIPEAGYYVLNNDRVIQLRNGRLLFAVAEHKWREEKSILPGVAMTYYSDDAGRTWKRGNTALECPAPCPAGYQEPGLVELKDRRILMFLRTQLGSQYFSYSSDGGLTWSTPAASPLRSPLSPASIERIPWTGELLAIWNDHGTIDASYQSNEKRGGKRTPLTAAISKDEGKTWTHAHDLLDSPTGWYCYTAIHFVDKHVLLGFVSGGDGLPGLSKTDIARFRVEDMKKAAGR